jgi:molybdenum cofactor biosynthesis enzyme
MTQNQQQPNPATVYDFEDLSEELPRPPLAAIRLFRSAGVQVSLAGWQALSTQQRWALVNEGAQDIINPNLAQVLISSLPLREIELTPKQDVNSPTIPATFGQNLGLSANDAAHSWQKLRPLDQFSLAHLHANTRLLWRAFTEISQRSSNSVAYNAPPIWRGLVGHCELSIGATGQIRAELMQLLSREKLLEGKAFLLARASGLRAARRAHEIFDLHAEAMAGTIELDWLVVPNEATVLWQCHASSWNGTFLPAASLLATTTATLCLYDMIKEFDPNAVMGQGKIIEEFWRVGKYFSDDTTMKLTVLK